jgi:hypothetical protein
VKLDHTNGWGHHCGGNIKIFVCSFRAVVTIQKKGKRISKDMKISSR